MRVILFILSVWLLCPFLLPAQDSRDMPTRTPEQEAARQTEMLRQALNLTEAQERVVYRINLHYARERQMSNSRAEALERVKRKNADLIVLNSLRNPGAGFAVATNQVTFVDRKGRVESLALKTKEEVASDILDYLPSLS